MQGVLNTRFPIKPSGMTALMLLLFGTVNYNAIRKREVTLSLRSSEPLILLLLALFALSLSSIQPFDRTTWLLEVFPVLIGAPLLVTTYRRFPLTPLLYRLLLLHALILIVGGHYTYTRVPVGIWVQQALDLGRNHFDRAGHFAQGFVPAILAREILIRTSPLKPGKWLFFLVVCVCLAFSAFYELIEWWSAMVLGEGAKDFLGTQGDPWDTQWDMFMALTGAITAQAALSRAHNREMQGLTKIALPLRN
jgi:putative membrane protein